MFGKTFNKYVSHDTRNEILKIMAHQVLQNVLHNMQRSHFLATMVDEATDKEQVTLVARWFDEEFSGFEDFLGMYSVSSIGAESIVSALNDALLLFQMPRLGTNVIMVEAQWLELKVVWRQRCKN